MLNTKQKGGVPMRTQDVIKGYTPLFVLQGEGWWRALGWALECGSQVHKDSQGLILNLSSRPTTA